MLEKLAAAAVKNCLFSLFERLGFHFDVPGKCCTAVTVGAVRSVRGGSVTAGSERPGYLLTFSCGTEEY